MARFSSRGRWAGPNFGRTPAQNYDKSKIYLNLKPIRHHSAQQHFTGTRAAWAWGSTSLGLVSGSRTVLEGRPCPLALSTGNLQGPCKGPIGEGGVKGRRPKVFDRIWGPRASPGGRASTKFCNCILGRTHVRILDFSFWGSNRKSSRNGLRFGLPG